MLSHEIKGIYALILSTYRPVKIQVGSLGLISFGDGEYVYVGSAINSIGARLRRHLARIKTARWHIDYLTMHDSVAVKWVILAEADKKDECRLSSALFRLGATPIRGFGSSDCRCTSHLYYVELPDYSLNVAKKAFKSLGLAPRTVKVGAS